MAWWCHFIEHCPSKPSMTVNTLCIFKSVHYNWCMFAENVSRYYDHQYLIYPLCDFPLRLFSPRYSRAIAVLPELILWSRERELVGCHSVGWTELWQVREERERQRRGVLPVTLVGENHKLCFLMNEPIAYKRTSMWTTLAQCLVKLRQVVQRRRGT